MQALFSMPFFHKNKKKPETSYVNNFSPYFIIVLAPKLYLVRVLRSL